MDQYISTPFGGPGASPETLRAVFDRSPVGLLVFDRKGRVVGANAAAGRMVGDLASTTCCALFGCRRRGTALEDGCLTQLVLERGAPVPEIRIDLDGPGAEESVWVLAAPIDAGDAQVVAHLRPGRARDRRRRTEPHWIGDARLRIRTLGRTRIESGETALDGEWLAHRPGEVLKYLVCHRSRVVPLEELVDVFWPDAGAHDRAGTSNVRQAIHVLRDRVEPTRGRHAQSHFIVARKGGYQLDIVNVDIDADEFEADVERGLEALNGGEIDAAETALVHALAIHDGDFLADEPYADWALAERDRLRALAGRALRAMTTIRLAHDDLLEALDYQGRLAELQPLDLDIQADLLRLMLRAGRHSDASRRVETVRRRYRRVFGEDPALGLDGLTAAES